MKARRTWVFLVAGMATIALAIGGCGNDDGGDGGSASSPSNEAPASSGGGGYGY